MLWVICTIKLSVAKLMNVLFEDLIDTLTCILCESLLIEEQLFNELWKHLKQYAYIAQKYIFAKWQ